MKRLYAATVSRSRAASHELPAHPAAKVVRSAIAPAVRRRVLVNDTRTLASELHPAPGSTRVFGAGPPGLEGARCRGADTLATTSHLVRSRSCARKTKREPRRTGIPRGSSERTHRRATLPQGRPCSTIAEAGLNFRVRNGIGCGPRSMDGGKTFVPDRSGSMNARVFAGKALARRAPNSRPSPTPGAFAAPGWRKNTVEVKPHDRLVPVSSTHCCASTPGLSTSWSRRGLKLSLRRGDTSSRGGLPA